MLPIHLEFDCIFVACIMACRRKLCLQADAKSICVLSLVFWVLLTGGHQVAPQSAGSNSFLMTGWIKFFFDDII